MSHRVKNLLHIATALTQITSRSASTKEDIAHELTNRLMALGRAQDLIRPVPGRKNEATLLGDWPAPGSEDTELGVLIERRCVMERRKFTREFKLEAVRLIRDRGVSYAQASHDLSVHQSQLRSWVKALADDPHHAFPGQGQMKPEQLEIAQLKREVLRLKAERDILKKAAAYFAKEST